MKCTVIVELRPDILDPEGKAIGNALGGLGFGAQKERLPLDMDAVADSFLELVETHGPDVAPRSEVVGPGDEPNGIFHGATLVRPLPCGPRGGGA